MTLPNLIGIGAQRAATTWMYHCLREHPEVFTTEKKELHFFDENFDKGLSWYQQHFASATEEVIAEITPNYLNVEAALQRMSDTIPDARIFVVLREPISRAYSSYRLLYNEHFQGRTFEEACAASPYMIRLSKYADDLQRAFSLYDRDKIAIFLYDDVRSDPARVVKDLYSFAGVDASFEPSSINTVYNAILYPDLQEFLQRIRLGGALNRFKESQLGKALKTRLSARKVRYSAKAEPESEQHRIASDAFIAELREEFRDDILKVQELIGRDLSAWL
ncbi:MAG: sulfotransferase [Woeseiaceae bacterium]|nr:sulfotransferase [Woeseiaceae bacterium]